MREVILEKLKEIEKEENVKILFAVESGSRAWGFPSKDSDYDVRFVYIRPVEWYLSIENKRDVLEYPINDLLDISGWDIKKALYLFKKSNPPLMEWLRSPIMYMEQYSFLERLKKLRKEYFFPKASIYHYLHMATGNYREYLQGSEVKIKKYFYVLRPILACRWLESRGTLPPVEFDKLLESQVNDPKLYSEVQNLLERKKSGEELDSEPRIDVINDFLEEQMDYYRKYVKGLDNKSSSSISVLNELFRETLKGAWE
ncbi:nucleotidyltransferase domain-containing protein [Clostridium sp. D2Q-11]|uniref:Nucleotidyltransferase domain-containing protein n=1 Tax=Anaeromonas frigoriresistens TaxID=2683708 RepID=A0A942Z679_9FIRM|nr:nucleotidyltransferase domain-containing protein [Anaeromonas frigoriresistens]MBS4537292.1 nucleotidyltransferase domain-containing protein [Anaeromonas frigoriresistens]